MAEMKKIIWKGQELNNMGALFDAAISVKDKEEATEFLQMYVDSGCPREVALSNLGYFAGYYSEKARRKIAELYGAMHPVFGGNFNPTPEEAFEAGKKLAKEK